MCTPGSTELRWQAIYALVHSAAMAVFMAIVVVFQLFVGRGELSIVTAIMDDVGDQDAERERRDSTRQSLLQNNSAFFQTTRRK